MINGRSLLVVLLLLIMSAPGLGQAEDNFIFRGQIVDTANNPVAGAEVYVFDSNKVKRPADFISNRTVTDGFFKVELPQGHYWVMAIMRVSGGSFGPLGKDDKHSGEPIEIGSAGKAELIKDFTVMDLREAARANQKRSETVYKISGRILNAAGLPVTMAYALADSHRQLGDVPRYLSTWTESDGRYVLFLPKGKYYIGGAKDFPLKSDYIPSKEVDFTKDTEGVDLIYTNQISSSSDSSSP